MTFGAGLALCVLAAGTVLVMDWLVRGGVDEFFADEAARDDAAARGDAEVAAYLSDTVGDVPRLPAEIERAHHGGRYGR